MIRFLIPQPISRRNRDQPQSADEPQITTWVLVLAAVASLMAALDAMVVSTALTTIRLDLGASIEQLEWTVNGYNLTLAVLLLPAAALGDRFGRRRMFTVGLGLFVAASAACALAPDAGSLIAARAVQGAGAALVITNALALVSAAFPAERRGWAIGILQGITGLAVVAGPVIGGAVAEGIDWEWIFWLNVPIGLAAIPLALARIEESFGGDAALDIGGFALVAGGALGIVWGLVRGNTAGWGSAEVVAALALGRGAGGRIRGLGAAGARADAADALLPLARVLVRQRGRVLPLRVAVRRGVLPRPVPADGLGHGPLEAGCGWGRGPGRCSSSRRSRARSWTASASGRCSSAASRSRPPGWRGSR